ncbi:MAG TPA: Gfo/Idh/MocA family oxidoreductase, partial [Bryobacteraceae bacterium]|nr:Gfo/Idh/MocA family oxidoreductase [Bryobacteraceae bacterium]
MDRRAFVASMLGAVAANAAADRIRIGFLGASHSHAWEKSVVVRGSPRWELAGVCEADAEIRARFEKADVRILSERELLEDPTIRVVAVESGVPQHAGHGQLALEAGKHLHLEKPPADNLKDLNSLLATAEKKNLLVQMGYMWRYHPGINRAL